MLLLYNSFYTTRIQALKNVYEHYFSASLYSRQYLPKWLLVILNEFCLLLCILNDDTKNVFADCDTCFSQQQLQHNLLEILFQMEKTDELTNRTRYKKRRFDNEMFLLYENIFSI